MPTMPCLILGRDDVDSVYFDSWLLSYLHPSHKIHIKEKSRFQLGCSLYVSMAGGKFTGVRPDSSIKVKIAPKSCSNNIKQTCSRQFGCIMQRIPTTSIHGIYRNALLLIVTTITAIIQRQHECLHLPVRSDALRRLAYCV